MAPMIEKPIGHTTQAESPVERNDPEYESAVALDQRIREALYFGLKENGRGAVLVVMSREPTEDWLVTYVGEDCAGSVADLVSRYNPDSEIILCFVYPEIRRFTAYRLPAPWRADGDSLQ